MKNEEFLASRWFFQSLRFMKAAKPSGKRQSRAATACLSSTHHSLLTILLVGTTMLTAQAQIPIVKGNVIDRKLTAMTIHADSVSMDFDNDQQQAAKADVVVAFGQVKVVEAQGWLESAYVKFAPYPAAKGYHVYVKGGSLADYTLLDAQLVRNYGSYGRADAVGLKAAADYRFRIVPTDSQGHEISTAATETSTLSVAPYDRSGFAHFNHTDGVGAYHDDGTLKPDARVVYVTRDNAKTVALDIISDKKGTKTTTYTGIQQIIYGYQKGYDHRPLSIRLLGTIEKEHCDELLSSAEGLQVKGSAAYQPMNITIEGIGDDATLRGFGLLVRNCASVELRNFANMLCIDDAVSLDTKNEHVWIHHLDLFYGQPGSDSDQVKGDGTVDVKADSRYVTIAYCHFWDNGKSSLCGMKSESGPNWVSYHHNWFDHSDSRHPRIRTMSVHIYNNYFDGNAKYGVGAAMKSNAFVEANYFRNCKYPILISRQGSDIASGGTGNFSGEDGGMVKSYGNIMQGGTYVSYQQNATQFDAYEAATRQEQVPATVAARQGGRTYDNFDTDPALMYHYTPDAASQVPAIVTGPAGAGRMGHGDFKFQFNNSTDDAHCNVNTALKQAITNYQPTLKGFYD